MAELVFVHGIAQEQQSADGLERAWTDALAGGIRVAGRESVADRLVGRKRPVISARMAFYGDLFLDRGAQGDRAPALTAEQSLVAEQLAHEWLQRAAVRSRDEKVREAALRELRHLASEEGAQGAGRALGTAIRALSRVPFFAPAAVSLAERFISGALAQVARYLTEQSLREQIQQRVLRHCDASTKVIVAHSLGSVVAYEIAHRLPQPLSLLVTIGSPLALRTVVYERLVPQPPTFPASVERWVNVTDRDDIVAAEYDLTGAFPGARTIETGQTVDNGAQPHSSVFYLAKSSVGQCVGEALEAVVGVSPDPDNH